MINPALRIEAPTGSPPREWTAAERANIEAAMQRIIAAEAADPLGTAAWQLRNMHTVQRDVLERAAGLLLAAKAAGFTP